MIDPVHLLTEDIIRDEYPLAKYFHDYMENYLAYALADPPARTEFPTEDEIVEKWKRLKSLAQTGEG